MRPGVSATVLALGVLWLGAACTGPTQQQPDLDVGAHVLQVCRAVGTPIPYAIDLPQPRNADLRFDPAFTEGCAEISHCLRGLMQPDERTSQ